LAAHRSEIARIAEAGTKPTFANTIVALERSGRLLDRVASVFFNLEAADTTPDLQAVARDVAPVLARHETAILMNARLFRRVDDLYDRRDRLRLDDEARRVLERTHLRFVRAGARLAKAAQKRVTEINQRLASLVTAFMQNVLKDEQAWRLLLDGERDLAGLPGPVRAAAARAAADEGLAGKYLVTLNRASVEAFLTFSARRDLRETAFKAWAARGENGGETDNRQIVAEIVALRTEHARLLGYDTFADYALADTMAKTPKAVEGLLGAVWPKAVARAKEEREALAALARAEGNNADIAPWDWRYYAEKVRRARFDLDDAEVRPYFQLDNMIAAAFDCATRLFGLRFSPRPDLVLYHPDVRAWEVSDAAGDPVGLFLGDYFARPSKRSGAWMSSFREQHKLGGGQRPVIVNVLNFARGAEGESTLLSFDDARTLFHEFGHGLHGLLSDVTYPSIAGTAVSRDFVELPSQLYEHWLSQPAVLKRFARHAKTGKAIPDALLKRLNAARTFNQGFATVEYTASALVDMQLYALKDARGLDVGRFERETLARIGMPSEIIMRHRLPHFMHIMSGYAAGYYSYLWSEVMDADAFAAFEEAGDIFDKPTAERLRAFVYAGGNSRDPEAAYQAFRGRPPRIDSLMHKRGFAAAGAVEA
jgi:peptidyl-dipeptidase Dcp